MFAYLLILLDVIMPFFAFGSFTDRKRIFVPLAESVSAFLCLYIVTSGLMWLFESFNVEFCLLTVSFVSACLFIARYLTCPDKGLKFFSYNGIKIDHRIILNKGAILIALLLSIGAYSTYGIGYNDGNAQTLALSILNGNNTHVFDIEEYETIRSESPYEYYFFDTISNIDNTDFTANYWITDEGSEDGETRMMADYGADPVYPSVLALSASIFGFSRMALIQAVFAFCMFVFIDEILRVLKCDWKLRSALILLLGVSPIMVYCNHTTLVEPVIGFCMILFMYFLLCKEDKLQIVSAAGVVAFSFLHSSVYTMLPLFLVIYWMFYIHTRKLRYLAASGFAMLGYIVSYIFLNIVAYENTSINYRLGLRFFKEKYYVFIIIISVIAAVGAMLLIILFNDVNPEKFSAFERGKGRVIFKIGVMLASTASVVFMIVTNIINCETYKDTLNITFVVFMVCSGIIILPYIVGRLISGSYSAGIKEAVVIVAFIYTVLLYSSLMKPMLDGYYYETRYLASFIPFIILTAGMMLRILKGEEKYYIPVIGIVLLLFPYTTSLLSPKTDCRMDMDIIEKVIDTIEARADEDTVILVEKDLMKYYYFPLLKNTDARVYPFEARYINNFCLDTEDVSSKVLYVTNSNGNAFKNKGTIRYLNTNKEYVISSKDVSQITGLPNAFHEKNGGIVQIIEVSSLSKMVNTSIIDRFSMDNVKIAVDQIEIDDKNVAHVTISLTDKSKLYYNKDKLSLSYHLDYEESDDVYENMRINIDSVMIEDYTFDFDLSNLDEKMAVGIDIVEEGVAWYSWNHKVPIIRFKETDGEWDYYIQYRVMGFPN